MRGHSSILPGLTVLGFLAGLVACSGSGPGPAATSTTPPTPDPGANPDVPRTRYSFNNQCFALKSTRNGKYIAVAGGGYAASADQPDGAEAFFFKPTALGQYLLYAKSGPSLVSASSVSDVNCTPGAAFCADPSNAASDASVFTVMTAGDGNTYPPAPAFDVEPNATAIDAYRAFVKSPPLPVSTEFTLANASRYVTVDGAGALGLAAKDDALLGQKFQPVLRPQNRCVAFPEAHNNISDEDNRVNGDTFKGAYHDPVTGQDRVLGMADVHVHTVSTTFLGGAKTGAPFHRFGVEQALASCASQHGEHGERDFIGAAYVGDTDGHATDGWPTLSEWPARESLTHESIYWKWLERAWRAGLRIMVNDVVENATLCELQRNSSHDTSRSCNEMESARRQIGTLYAMQDYIDAQKGGPGKGWFRLVLDPVEARQEIVKGNLAVVIGIEVSNLFNCQVTYKPTRTQDSAEEDGAGGSETSYKCSMGETGNDAVKNVEIKRQIDDMWKLGARQIITIHEFDNAFGGNGIFNADFLNLGNRENSGGNPTPGVPPNNPFDVIPQPSGETPTGEFWTTQDCPTDTYLWGDGPGKILLGDNPPACQPTGLNGHYGGVFACYAASTPQCNARWLTRTGLYTYKKLMEYGFIIDLDHLTLHMKSELLRLSALQKQAYGLAYPFVSTHGQYGGTATSQAVQNLLNGGFMYPSLDSVLPHGSNADQQGLIANMDSLKALWSGAKVPYAFAVGFGTDTNGLSGQDYGRTPEQIAAEGQIDHDPDAGYPYTLFKGPGWDEMDEFKNVAGITFGQPFECDDRTGKCAGTPRKWSHDNGGIKDKGGSAHYGMLSDVVREVQLDVVAHPDPAGKLDPSHLRDLYNSAEVYLQTWTRTLAASSAIVGPNRTGQAAGANTDVLQNACNGTAASPLPTYPPAICP